MNDLIFEQVRLISKNYLQNMKHILRMAILIVHLETLHFYHKVSLKLKINDNYLIIKIYNTPFPCKYDKKCISETLIIVAVFTYQSCFICDIRYAAVSSWYDKRAFSTGKYALSPETSSVSKYKSEGYVSVSNFATCRKFRSAARWSSVGRAGSSSTRKYLKSSSLSCSKMISVNRLICKTN